MSKLDHVKGLSRPSHIPNKNNTTREALIRGYFYSLIDALVDICLHVCLNCPTGRLLEVDGNNFSARGGICGEKFMDVDGLLVPVLDIAV